MDEFLIPVAKPSFDLGFSLGAGHLLQQEAKLLAKGVQRLPPVAAAVLVLVPREDLVEEAVDVEKHGLVVGRCHDEGGGCDVGGGVGVGGHFGGV